MPTFDYDSSQGGGGLLDEGYDGLTYMLEYFVTNSVF